MPEREPINCERCGVVRGYGNEVPTPSMCEECPPVPCVDCGWEDDRSCLCWRSFSGLANSDIKGHFASIGLSVSDAE